MEPIKVNIPHNPEIKDLNLDKLTYQVVMASGHYETMESILRTNKILEKIRGEHPQLKEEYVEKFAAQEIRKNSDKYISLPEQTQNIVHSLNHSAQRLLLGIEKYYDDINLSTKQLFLNGLRDGVFEDKDFSATNAILKESNRLSLINESKNYFISLESLMETIMKQAGKTIYDNFDPDRNKLLRPNGKKTKMVEESYSELGEKLKVDDSDLYNILFQSEVQDAREALGQSRNIAAHADFNMFVNFMPFKIPTKTYKGQEMTIDKFVPIVGTPYLETAIKTYQKLMEHLKVD